MKQAEQYGHYELRRRIARGDVSEVFLAKLPEGSGAQGLAVVRRVLPHRSQNQEFVEQFLKEAELSARLDHPNLVQIDDVGELDGSYFIATEYLPGGNVLELVERRGKPLPLEAAIFITVEVCAGLQFAHALAAPDGSPLGAVHGDLSPRNVIATVDGVVKVVDFGLAKAWAQLGAAPTTGRAGAYAHLAPELARGESTDRRTDVYGCGALLYYLVSGAPPFPDATTEALAGARSSAPLPFRSLGRDVPDEIEAIVLKAMALEPKDRYATCGAMRRKLDEAADALWLQCTAESVADVVRAAFPEAAAPEDEILFLPDVSAQGEPEPMVASRRPLPSAAAEPSPSETGPAAVAPAPAPAAARPAAEEVGPARVERRDDSEQIAVAPAPAAAPVADAAEPRRPARLGLLVGGLIAAVVVALAALGVAAWAIWLRPQQTEEQLMSAGLPPGVAAPALPQGAAPVTSPTAAPAEAPKPPSTGTDTASSLAAPPGDGTAAPTGTPATGTSMTPTAPAAGTATPSKAPSTAEGSGPGRGRDTSERSDGRDRRGSAAAQGGTGYLTVLTRPYSRVYMNSRLLGSTPILRREVPAGRHRLRLVNPDLPSKAVQITVRPGQVTQVRETLGGP